MLIFQFVVSTATSFVAGYFIPYFFMGVTDVGKRMLCGVILGFVVAAADLYFIMRYFLQAEGVIDLEKLHKKYN